MTTDQWFRPLAFFGATNASLRLGAAGVDDAPEPPALVLAALPARYAERQAGRSRAIGDAGAGLRAGREFAAASTQAGRHAAR